ncbi:MAG: hypothetical protein AAF202_13205, partial [Pseudomonadota bacterium]
MSSNVPIKWLPWLNQGIATADRWDWVVTEPSFRSVRFTNAALFSRYMFVVPKTDRKLEAGLKAHLDNPFEPLRKLAWMGVTILFIFFRILEHLNLLRGFLLTLSVALPTIAYQFYSAGLAATIIAPSQSRIFESVSELARLISQKSRTLVVRRDAFTKRWIDSSTQLEAQQLREAFLKNPLLEVGNDEELCRELKSPDRVALISFVASVPFQECASSMQLRFAEKASAIFHLRLSAFMYSR